MHDSSAIKREKERIKRQKEQNKQKQFTMNSYTRVYSQQSTVANVPVIAAQANQADDKNERPVVVVEREGAQIDQVNSSDKVRKLSNAGISISSMAARVLFLKEELTTLKTTVEEKAKKIKADTNLVDDSSELVEANNAVEAMSQAVLKASDQLENVDIKLYSGQKTTLSSGDTIPDVDFVNLYNAIIEANHKYKAAIKAAADIVIPRYDNAVTELESLVNQDDCPISKDLQNACKILLESLNSIRDKDTSADTNVLCNEIVANTHKLITSGSRNKPSGNLGSEDFAITFNNYNSLIQKVHDKGSKGSKWARVKQVMEVILGLSLIALAVIACVGTFGAAGPLAFLAMGWAIASLVAVPVGAGLIVHAVKEKDPYRKTASTMSEISFFAERGDKAHSQQNNQAEVLSMAPQR